ncbi:ead/Ea22-like family protein [Escherichia coli]|nr:ead/Ea22-like family protein [Escherichia coli]
MARMTIDYQALRDAAEAIKIAATPQKLLAFRMKVTPQVVLELLDERERNQQYIKRRDQENEDIALTVGKLRVELEAAKSKLNEQREYYEGVIADGSKRIAKMEAIKSAAEKLVRCKGRYHSEQNYRALAALFGITVPDLPPLEVEPALYMNRFTRKTFSLEEQPGADKEPEIYMPLYAAPPAPVVPEKLPREYRNGWPLAYSDYAEGWNDCREAMLQSGNFRENTNSSTNNFRKIPETSTTPPVTQALLLGGFTIEDAKELHEDLVRSHISKALSGENMKKKDRDADLRWIHGVIVQAAWFVKATLEQNALSGNSPVTPDSWISCSERMPDDRQEVNQ